jgi:uncharacterized short protein YbdD (DUF466 family)
MPGRRTDGQADGRTDVTLSKRSAARGPGLQLLAQLFGALRRIAGMPDYGAHLEHLRRVHPEKPIPSEREFYEDFVRNRYQDGPTRCC